MNGIKKKQIVLENEFIIVIIVLIIIVLVAYCYYCYCLLLLLLYIYIYIISRVGMWNVRVRMTAVRAACA